MANPVDARELDARWMDRALELAARGAGAVEPNPMVGCVLACGSTFIAEGWHERFGEAHAEVQALRQAGSRAAGATAYVTLEPCSHQGKTPPCADALLAAGIRRVVAAQVDPFPQVSGQGIARLQAAGIAVEVGLRQAEAESLNAPYRHLLRTGRPWVIAKWAMTLDGKIATHSGDSRWISNEASRQVVQQLRGRVDAILIGSRTAQRDDPRLLAVPAGPRVATRVVLDSHACLEPSCQLFGTIAAAPLLIAVGPNAPEERCRRLQQAGAEVWQGREAAYAARCRELLAELGRRRMTNVLVEGGGGLLGALFDALSIQEVHTFIAPRLIGGEAAPSPIAGIGESLMAQSRNLREVQVRMLDGDLYLSGRIGSESLAASSAASP